MAHGWIGLLLDTFAVEPVRASGANCHGHALTGKMRIGEKMRRRILSISIHDCEVQTFRSGGSGGQNQNKRDTGVRVIHHPSGARGESREERSQLQNKKTAFMRMVNSDKFKLWLRIETGREVVKQQEADLLVPPEEVKVEIRVGGQWTQVSDMSVLS